jgi:hypothetical protein
LALALINDPDLKDQLENAKSKASSPEDLIEYLQALEYTPPPPKQQGGAGNGGETGLLQGDKLIKALETMMTKNPGLIKSLNDVINGKLPSTTNPTPNFATPGDDPSVIPSPYTNSSGIGNTPQSGVSSSSVSTIYDTQQNTDWLTTLDKYLDEDEQFRARVSELLGRDTKSDTNLKLGSDFKLDEYNTRAAEEADPTATPSKEPSAKNMGLNISPSSTDVPRRTRTLKLVSIILDNIVKSLKEWVNKDKEATTQEVAKCIYKHIRHTVLINDTNNHYQDMTQSITNAFMQTFTKETHRAFLNMLLFGQIPSVKNNHLKMWKTTTEAHLRKHVKFDPSSLLTRIFGVASSDINALYTDCTKLVTPLTNVVGMMKKNAELKLTRPPIPGMIKYDTTQQVDPPIHKMIYNVIDFKYDPSKDDPTKKYSVITDEMQLSLMSHTVINHNFIGLIQTIFGDACSQSLPHIMPVIVNNALERFGLMATYFTSDSSDDTVDANATEITDIQVLNNSPAEILGQNPVIKPNVVSNEPAVVNQDDKSDVVSDALTPESSDVKTDEKTDDTSAKSDEIISATTATPTTLSGGASDPLRATFSHDLFYQTVFELSSIQQLVNDMMMGFLFEIRKGLRKNSGNPIMNLVKSKGENAADIAELLTFSMYYHEHVFHHSLNPKVLEKLAGDVNLMYDDDKNEEGVNRKLFIEYYKDYVDLVGDDVPNDVRIHQFEKAYDEGFDIKSRVIQYK